MPKLRQLSGEQLIKILTKQGFFVVRQKGSHVRLSFLKGETTHLVTVPLHDVIDRGTLRSILRALQQCLTEAAIRELFYTK